MSNPQSTNKEKSSPFLRGAVVPALTVAGGVGTGGIVGAHTAKNIANLPRIKEILDAASPAQKAKYLKRIGFASGALGSSLGMGVAAGSKYFLDRELEKRKNAEKTAMFMHCLQALREGSE